ncbi:MAG: hydroxysqualene dehydroxylase HpnE [Azoarcus sp.]|jgi:squalene-associated FAD-dependent desaturase|nr:hydroxysqualene dehydroxylase HpnE [Azoarcus sp.]
MASEIAIIGAGYAGMACAVELAHQCVAVTVFERSHTLGGRARVVHKDGHTFDNGQHLLLGAYTELARLLRLTGVSPRLLERLPLTLHVPRQLHLRAAPLPAPLHLAVGLLRAHGLGWRERIAPLALLRYLKRARFRLPAAMSVAELLSAARQPARLRNLVWEPLCVAALNTPMHEASAQIFANVLRDSLAASAAASELLIPRIDLSELFPVPAARYLATRDGEVRTGNPITALVPESEGFRLTGDPHERIWRQVVIATAPHHAAPLLATIDVCADLAAQIAALPTEPITTVYLAFGPAVTLPAPMIGLANGPAQWAFDRARCGGPAGLIAAVLSAHAPGDSIDPSVIIAQLEHELDRILPKPEWVQVITEKRATVASRPNQTRPGNATPRRNLWLAGDYVGSDYPATLEAAVRAGVKCARGILETLETRAGVERG